jgi:hypothetical protein
MDDLAERMVPVAMRVVGAVHDEGAGAVARALAPLTPQERIAVTVVLAAMVNPDRTPSELLAWVDWDGAPVNMLALFGSTPVVDDLGDNPHLWSDLQCHELAKRHRRVPTPDLTLADLERAETGYREWDRRRHQRKRDHNRARR